MKTIKLAEEFTRFPSGRYKKNGSTSGEAFRERFLEGPLRAGESLLVDLDGAVGYGSSFLEEAFGGLVRSLGMSDDDVFKLLQIKSTDPALTEEIKLYIREASMASKL